MDVRNYGRTMLLFNLEQQYSFKQLYICLLITLFLYNKYIVCLISFIRSIELFAVSN